MTDKPDRSKSGLPGVAKRLKSKNSDDRSFVDRVKAMRDRIDQFGRVDPNAEIGRGPGVRAMEAIKNALSEQADLPGKIYDAIEAGARVLTSSPGPGPGPGAVAVEKAKQAVGDAAKFVTDKFTGALLGTPSETGRKPSTPAVFDLRRRSAGAQPAAGQKPPAPSAPSAPPAATVGSDRLRRAVGATVPPPKAVSGSPMTGVATPATAVKRPVASLAQPPKVVKPQPPPPASRPVSKPAASRVGLGMADNVATAKRPAGPPVVAKELPKALQAREPAANEGPKMGKQGKRPAQKAPVPAPRPDAITKTRSIKRGNLVTTESEVLDAYTRNPIITAKYTKKYPDKAGPKKAPVPQKKEKVWKRDKWGKWGWVDE